MSFSRRIELVSGLATGLLWLAYWLALDLSIDGLSVEGFLSGFIFFGIPGLIVAVGAYSHAVRGRTWGRVVLTVGCSLLILVFLIFLVGGIGYWGKLVLLTTLAPSLAGIVTVIASRAKEFDGA